MEPRISVTPYNAVTFVGLGKKLDTRAERLVVSYIALGVLTGLAVGYFVGSRTGSVSGWPEIMGAALCGLVGMMIGEEKAFELRLRAQTILCLASIEESSRRI